MKLLSYQEPHYEKILKSLRSYGVAVDGSDTGTGKTYVAVKAIATLGKPTLVVCPKSVIPVWRRLLREAGVKAFDVVNYEKLVRGTSPYGAPKKVGRSKVFAWSLVENSLVVFDEAHRCKGEKTLSGIMLSSAKRQHYKILMLSATLCQSPLDMKHIGYALGLYASFSLYWEWCFKYGARRSHIGNFLEWSPKHNQDNLRSLHHAIYKHKGSRMRIAELGDAFPDTLITADTYNFVEAKKAYKELEKRIAEAHDEALFAENELTYLLKERMACELGKVAGIVELVKDGIDEGNSVVVFVNFVETRKLLCQKLKTTCAVYGGQSSDERQKNIEHFQNNTERVIIAATQAAGEGISLHDLSGTYPRLSLISPTYNAVHLRQCLGRVHRAGAKSKSIQKILFAAGTIEEEVCKVVQAKLNNIDLINDGDLSIRKMERTQHDDDDLIY